MRQLLEMVILDEKQNGVGAISVVSDPAIQSDFVALSNEPIKLQAVEDEEKRLLMGAVMIPNKRIYRRDFAGHDEVDIFFSADTIRRTSELFFKNSNQSNSTLEHGIDLKGNTVVESWIKEDNVNDKSVKYGIDAPIGSWIISMKIEDDATWLSAKNNIVNGFSIEGLYRGMEATILKSNTNKMAEKEKSLLQKLEELISTNLSKDSKEDLKAKEEKQTGKDPGKETEKVDLSGYVKEDDLEAFGVKLSEILVTKITESLESKINEVKEANVNLKKQLDERKDAEPTNTKAEKVSLAEAPKTKKGRIGQGLSQILNKQ